MSRTETVQLTAVRRLTDEDDLHTVDRLGRGFGVPTASGVVGLDLGTIGFEHGLVGIVRAERLLVGQEVVTGITVLDGHDITDATQLLDALEQNDFHG
jgi:hypothetical protein